MSKVAADKLGDTKRVFNHVAAIISSRLPQPFIVLVTAASDFDDTDLIARGLAAHFQGLGGKTALVLLDDDRLPDAAKTVSMPNPNGYMEIRFPGARSKAVSRDVAEQADEWRRTFDNVIIDGATLEFHSSVINCLRVVDGVLVAVAPKRAVLAADSDLATLLRMGRSVFLGVVKTPRRRTGFLISGDDASHAASPPKGTQTMLSTI